MSAPAVRVVDLAVRFLFDRQRRPVTPALAAVRRRVSETWGLRGLTFSIGPGESVALLGASGAGKTTVLRVLAGILAPDRGSVEVHGCTASLLSIDGGLLPALTGRENAYLLGVLNGLSRQRARAAAGEVEDEIRLGRAFDQPVSSFSQGMRARLGFTVAIQARPEILLLDEVHEALDQEFRSFLERHAREVVASGGIVVATGHDHRLLERLCHRALLLHAGTLRADGAFGDVIHVYRQQDPARP